eukprot:4505655-Alexandrium_andersonii.AAC.1
MVLWRAGGGLCLPEKGEGLRGAVGERKLNQLLGRTGVADDCGDAAWDLANEQGRPESRLREQGVLRPVLSAECAPRRA